MCRESWSSLLLPPIQSAVSFLSRPSFTWLAALIRSLWIITLTQSYLSRIRPNYNKAPQVKRPPPWHSPLRLVWKKFILPYLANKKFSHTVNTRRDSIWINCSNITRNSKMTVESIVTNRQQPLFCMKKETRDFWRVSSHLSSTDFTETAANPTVFYLPQTRSEVFTLSFSVVDIPQKHPLWFFILLVEVPTSLQHGRVVIDKWRPTTTPFPQVLIGGGWLQTESSF